MTRSTRITRRRFVAGAAGTAAAVGAGVPLVGCGGNGGKRAGRRGSVAVVGAGLAGLAAAYELDRKGWRVTVVEARDRIGGRCHTFRELAGGQVAEAGGEFIDTSHTALLGYAKRFGLDLDDAQSRPGGLRSAIYAHGELRDYDAVVDKEMRKERARFDTALSGYAAAIDVRDPARTGAGLDAQSAADVLDDLALAPEARALVEADLRIEYGVEPDRLSLLFLTVGTALTDDLRDKDIERWRIRGGNDRLPGALARRLGPRVHLRAAVSRIADRQSGVRVVAAGQRVDADYCVVAAPLPALRAVEFDPPLPRRVRQAIADVGYGDIVKTVLQYDSRFWRRDGWDGDTLVDGRIGATWDATNAQPGTPGVLMTYTAAAAAAPLGNLAARDRIERTVRAVDSIYPGSADELATSATVAWRRERFSGGAYSAWAPGQYARLWPALRRPYGRVYLAGEHTDIYASYMEGAVRSGRRVAAAIDFRGI